MFSSRGPNPSNLLMNKKSFFYDGDCTLLHHVGIARKPFSVCPGHKRYLLDLKENIKYGR